MAFSTASCSGRRLMLLQHLPRNARRCIRGVSGVDRSVVRSCSSPRVRSPHRVAASSSSAPSSTSSSSTAAAEVDEELDPHVLDIRVGKVLRCERHADADSLYVEEVDVGEESPRTICSGLVSFMPASALTGSTVTVLCNLKARKMRGVSSHGMLLCASNDAHDAVELLRPPEAAAAGERVRFGGAAESGAEDVTPREPETPNRVAKKKMWEALQPHLRYARGRY